MVGHIDIILVGILSGGVDTLNLNIILYKCDEDTVYTLSWMQIGRAPFEPVTSFVGKCVGFELNSLHLLILFFTIQSLAVMWHLQTHPWTSSHLHNLTFLLSIKTGLSNKHFENLPSLCSICQQSIWNCTRLCSTMSPLQIHAILFYILVQKITVITNVYTLTVS